MIDEQVEERVAHRAAVHAALGDATRLRIVDQLAAGDASAAELSRHLDVPSNLLAHHLRTLESVGLVVRRPSEGDGRRAYLQLVPAGLDGLTPPEAVAPPKVVFVCTANSARSQLAEALWGRASRIPAVSAGTQPASAINPGAVAVARRHGLALPGRAPRTVEGLLTGDELVVTVCDRAHEQLAPSYAGTRAPLHWSVPDPAKVGTAAAFDAAYDELAGRVDRLAPMLQPR